MTSTGVVNSLLKGPQETYQYSVWEDAKQVTMTLTGLMKATDHNILRRSLIKFT